MYVPKTIAFTSTQILPNFFFQSQKCMSVVTAIGGNSYQSKFATNSIHKIITTFSLPILLQHSLFLCKTYSFKACILLQLHSKDLLLLNQKLGPSCAGALQGAAAHSASVSYATLYLQLQNFTETFARFSITPQSPSLRRASDFSSDIASRCQKMVLCVRPNSFHPLSGSSPITLFVPFASCTAFYDLFPHQNLALTKNMVLHHVRIFKVSLVVFLTKENPPLLQSHGTA